MYVEIDRSVRPKFYIIWTGSPEQYPYNDLIDVRRTKFGAKRAIKKFYKNRVRITEPRWTTPSNRETS